MLNYGAFTREFVYSEKKLCKIGPDNPADNPRENWPKSGPFFYNGNCGILRILWRFFFIKEYCKKLRSVVFPLLLIGIHGTVAVYTYQKIW